MMIAFVLQELQDCVNELKSESMETPTLDGAIAFTEAAILVEQVRKAIITKSLAEIPAEKG